MPPKSFGSQYFPKFDRERNVPLGIHFENNRFIIYSTPSLRKKILKISILIVTHKLVVVEIVLMLEPVVDASFQRCNEKGYFTVQY